MDPVWQNIFAVIFVIAWIGMTIVLFARYRAMQRKYLRQYPPVAGIPLDM